MVEREGVRGTAEALARKNEFQLSETKRKSSAQPEPFRVTLSGQAAQQKLRVNDRLASAAPERHAQWSSPVDRYSIATHCQVHD
jgi:hypothetical protein